MSTISLQQAESLFEDKDALYDELLDGVDFEYHVQIQNTIIPSTLLDVRSKDTLDAERVLRTLEQVHPLVKQAAFGLINLAESMDIIHFPFFSTVTLNGCAVNVSKVALPSYTVVLDSGEEVCFSLQEMAIRGVYNVAN